MNVIFCGYRQWASDVFKELANHPKVNCIKIIKSNEEYLFHVDSFGDNIDFILFLGWSWIIPPEITKKYLCLGIHPSDLPNYRGGSPLQHQIINGVVKSKVTLMTLSSEKLDGGEIWLKEDLDLSGNTMDEIFLHLVTSSKKLLKNFIENYSSIKPQQPKLDEGSYYKRRLPSQSEITLNQLQEMSLLDIYNFIRCLTDPYPNAYISDKEGNKLLFKEVAFISVDDKNKTITES